MKTLFWTLIIVGAFAVGYLSSYIPTSSRTRTLIAMTCGGIYGAIIFIIIFHS